MMVTYCKCGWEFTYSKNCRVKCPQCKEYLDLTEGEDQIVTSYDYLEVLREYWRSLHRFPYSEAWDDPTVRFEWWRRWNELIPNVNCQCRKHWKEMVEKYPPDFSSRAGFFAWTVDRHNDVNIRLGKPTVTLNEAVGLYLPTISACAMRIG